MQTYNLNTKCLSTDGQEHAVDVYRQENEEWIRLETHENVLANSNLKFQVGCYSCIVRTEEVNESYTYHFSETLALTVKSHIVIEDQPPKIEITDFAQDGVKIKQDLFDRLTRTQVLSEKDAVGEDEQCVILNSQQSNEYMNGYTFSRYLIALKLITKQQFNQDLNFNLIRLIELNQDARLQKDIVKNWVILAEQLDKVGVTIDQETRQEINNSEQFQIDRLFTRIERFSKILCGPDVLLFENVPENLFDLDELVKQLKEEASLMPSLTLSINEIQEIMAGKFNQVKPSQSVNQSLEFIKEEDETSNINTMSNLNIPIKQSVIASRKIKQGIDITEIDPQRPYSEVESTLELLLCTLSNAFNLTPTQAATLITDKNRYLIAACIKGIKNGNFQPIINWYELLLKNKEEILALIIEEYISMQDANSFTGMLDTLACGFYSQNLAILTLTFQFFYHVMLNMQEHDEVAQLCLKWFLSTDDGGLKLSLHAVNHQQELAALFIELCFSICDVEEQVENLFKDEIMLHSQSSSKYLQTIYELFPIMNPKKIKDLIPYWIEIAVRQAENDGKHSIDERLTAMGFMSDIWLKFPDQINQLSDTAIIQILKRSVRERTKSVRLASSNYLFTLLDTFAKTKNQSAPTIYKALVFSIVENPGDPTIREFYFTNFKQVFTNHPSIPIGLLVEPLLKQIAISLSVSVFLKSFDMEFFQFIANHPKLTQSTAYLLMSLVSKLCLVEVCFGTSLIGTYIKLIQRFYDDFNEISQNVLQFTDLCMQSVFEIHYQQIKTRELNRKRSYSQQQLQRSQSQQNELVVHNKIKLSLIGEIIQRVIRLGENNLNNQINQQLLHIQQRIKDELNTQSLLVQFLLQSLQDQIVVVIEQEMATAVVPFNVKKETKSNFQINQRAIAAIESIKKQKQLKDEQIRYENEQRKASEQNKRNKLKKLIDRRRIELGIPAQIEYPESLILVKESNQQPKSGVQWLDVEEDKDKQACVAVVKQNARVWRMLFNKYSNTGHKIRPLVDGFDGKSDRTISLAESIKMLKDMNVLPQIFTKHDVVNFFRRIKGSQQQFTQLDYKQFLVLSQQVAFNVFQDSALSDRINRFVTQIKYTISGYTEEPDAEIIQALNQRIDKNPDYALPEGFAKVKQLHPILTYEVPAQLLEQVGQSKVIAITLVDELLNQIFGFHFLEPQVNFEESTKVKQVIYKPIVKKQGYMQDLEKNQKLTNDLVVRLSIDCKQKVQLPLKMKMLVQDSAPETREITDQAAMVLEQMIQSIEKSRKYNNALIQRINQAEQEKTLKELKELKRKERDVSVKKQIEVNKSIKEQLAAKLLEERKKKEIRDNEALKRKQDAIRADIAKIASEARARKEAQPILMLPPVKNDNQAQLKAQRQRSSTQLKKEVQKLSELNHHVQQYQEQVQIKELEYKMQIKRKAESQFAANREQRQQAQFQQQKIQHFLLQPDVLAILEIYSQTLEKYFKFYCQLGKADISFDAEFRQKHLHFKEFVKFGFQSKVVPVLLTADEHVQIFRAVSKHQDQSQFIDYESFKNCLVRIATYSHDSLGGMSEEQLNQLAEIDQQRRNGELKLKQASKKKEFERKVTQDQVLAEMREQWEEKQKRAKLTQSRLQVQTLTSSASETSIQSRNLAAITAREQAEFEKWLKQQENLGNGVAKRMQHRQSQFDDSESAGSLYKSKIKVLEKLETSSALSDKLIKNDLRDNRQVKRDLNVNLITAATFESLLQFIGLEVGEVTPQFDSILNQQRIEVQGQLPVSKIKELKRSFLPPKLVVIREQDDEQRMDKRKRGGQPRGISQSNHAVTPANDDFDHINPVEIVQQDQTEQQLLIQTSQEISNEAPNAQKTTDNNPNEISTEPPQNVPSVLLSEQRLAEISKFVNYSVDELKNAYYSYEKVFAQYTQDPRPEFLNLLRLQTPGFFKDTLMVHELCQELFPQRLFDQDSLNYELGLLRYAAVNGNFTEDELLNNKELRQTAMAQLDQSKNFQTAWDVDGDGVISFKDLVTFWCNENGIQQDQKEEKQQIEHRDNDAQENEQKQQKHSIEEVHANGEGTDLN